MPDDSAPPPYDPRRRVGTGLAGETTHGEGHTVGPAANRPLEVIGDFEVLAKLGQGGMGAVYRARQVSLDREVALKILPANYEADASYVARFEREARIAASLAHPNLVRVYSAGVAEGCHYIAMELVEGETLAQWVKRGALPPLEALRIVLDVARALDCGWRTAQIIHRDIKPGNIFLSMHGDVKLGDLGLAKLVGSDTTGLTQTGAAMGTPHYISPEQARGDKELDFRADIYSLGCTLYHLLTKQTPYLGSDAVAIFHHHIHSPPPALLKVIPQCPLPLARLVSKMMKKQRRERHGSYEELIAAIESVRAQLDPAIAAPTILPAGDIAGQAPRLPGGPAPSSTAGAAALQPATRQPKRNLWLGIAAGLAALGIVAWLVWPKEERLTAAQRWSQDHAGERSAAVAGVNDPGGPASLRPATTPASAPGSNLPSSNSSLSPSTEPWQDVLHDPAKLVLTGGAERTAEGLRLPNNSRVDVARNQGSRNGAVRMLATFGELHAELHAVTKDGTYRLGTSGNVVGLTLYDNAAKQNITISKFPLREPLQRGQDFELELRVVGQTFTAKLNGEVLGSITNGTSPLSQFGAGVIDHQAAPALVKALEVTYLDAPAAARLSPSNEPWQDLLADPGRLNLSGGAAIAAGTMNLPMHGVVRVQGTAADGAIRVVRTFDANSAGHQLWARVGKDQRYELYASSASRLRLQRHKGESNDKLGDFLLPQPLAPGSDYELEFRVSGTTLTAKVNGAVVGEVQDDTFPGGGFAASNSRPGSSVLKAFQFLSLGGAEAPSGAASATPAAARLSQSTEPWQDVLHDPAKLGLSGAVERVPDGLRFTDYGYAMRGRSRGPKRDGAVRMLANFGGGLRPQLMIRAAEAAGQYQLYVRSSNVVVLGRYEAIGKGNAKQWTVLREFSLHEPLQPGQNYELELRAAGQALTAKFNGEVLGMVTDGSFPEGDFGLAVTDHVTDHYAAPALVKALEVLDLDAPGGTR